MLEQFSPSQRMPPPTADLRHSTLPAPVTVTLSEPSLDACYLTQQVEQLRTAYFRACPEVCTSVPGSSRVSTRSSASSTRGGSAYSTRHRSTGASWRRASRSSGTRRPRIRTASASPSRETRCSRGSTTTRFKGVVLYPEFLGLALWPELHTLPYRAANPYMISPEQARILNEEAFPPWLDRSILEWARTEATTSDSPPDFTLYQQLVFFPRVEAEHHLAHNP